MVLITGKIVRCSHLTGCFYDETITLTTAERDHDSSVTNIWRRERIGSGLIFCTPVLLVLVYDSSHFLQKKSQSNENATSHCHQHEPYLWSNFLFNNNNNNNNSETQA